MGNEFQFLYNKWAFLENPFEAPNGHLVHPLDFTKLPGSVGFELSAPTNERVLLQEHMCPGKDREQVASQRVIPGRAKADKDAAAGFEQRIHGLQDVAGFRKMFERVERNDDLHGIGDGGV
jgi:hypothetical protein